MSSTTVASVIVGGAVSHRSAIVGSRWEESAGAHWHHGVQVSPKGLPMQRCASVFVVVVLSLTISANARERVPSGLDPILRVRLKGRIPSE